MNLVSDVRMYDSYKVDRYVLPIVKRFLPDEVEIKWSSDEVFVFHRMC